MIHERIIDLHSDNPPVDMYYDDNGWPIAPPGKVNTENPEHPFRCPKCGQDTFGYFAPFEERGIKRWCSACHHMDVDVAEWKAYAQSHEMEYEEV